MADSEKTPEKRKGEHLAPFRFQEGNPGRPKGSRNKLGEAFIAALYEDFTENGAEVIVDVRTTKPVQYLRVIASLLPKELTLNFGEDRELSDDELVERIRVLTETVSPLLLAGIGEPENNADGEAVAAKPPAIH